METLGNWALDDFVNNFFVNMKLKMIFRVLPSKVEKMNLEKHEFSYMTGVVTTNRRSIIGATIMIEVQVRHCNRQAYTG